jgi:hypothetical protein
MFLTLLQQQLFTNLIPFIYHAEKKTLLQLCLIFTQIIQYSVVNLQMFTICYISTSYNQCWG